MSAAELYRRLRCVQALVSVAGQHADDLCTFREHLECARIAVDHLLRDLEVVV
jgi:hypothetical protein